MDLVRSSKLSQSDLESGSDANGKRGNSLRTYLIIGITVVIFIILTIFIVLTYGKSLQIQRMQQIMETNAELASITSKKNINQVETKQPKQKHESVKGIITVGSNKVLSLTEPSSPTDAEGPYYVNQWNVELMFPNKAAFGFTEYTTIVIKTNGMYNVYAQMAFRMKMGTASFEIRLLKDDNLEGIRLAQCVSSFSQMYAELKTCYTSASVRLNEGDRLLVAVFRHSLTMDFSSEKSFFGANLIEEL